MPEWLKTLLQYLIVESTQDSGDDLQKKIEELLKKFEDK